MNGYRETRNKSRAFAHRVKALTGTARERLLRKNRNAGGVVMLVCLSTAYATGMDVRAVSGLIAASASSLAAEQAAVHGLDVSFPKRTCLPRRVRHATKLAG